MLQNTMFKFSNWIFLYQGNLCYFLRKSTFKNIAIRYTVIVPCAFFSHFSRTVNIHVHITGVSIIQSPTNSLIKNYRSFLTHPVCDNFPFSLLSLNPFPSFSPIPQVFISFQMQKVFCLHLCFSKDIP